MTTRTRLLVGGSIAAATATVALWVRYLARRQHYWQGRLSDSIPVNSQYWRDRATREGELLYVAIGDSTAQGIGASRPAHSYVGFIARHVRQATGRPVRVVNLAISGATIGDAIARELPRLAALDAELMTVCIGANDIAAFDPDRFAAQVDTLFDALPSHAIVADLPSFYFLPAQKKVVIANRILVDAARARRLRVVPLYRATDRQGLWGVSTQFAGDLFHPNDRGYRIWADTFAPAVDERLRAIGAIA
ncbi:SGNH/GDSL hydrolase family protein [Herbiconiux daphne]|uniref:SGNH/GDSL hydrolase family protein n=1 Tax=Herbiconiux daphne TaxID=2970914 RepID=A0ABT2H2H8_9MICO|nr:SGNH/GDSL hydrolase family protein [Herbiconiux daphne]MCS5734112.1 SGNH/GDSL hydrolase family protein [Herbiconiux daphne]